MKEIVWSVILVLVISVIAYSQYDHSARPSYADKTLRKALTHYVQHFDSEYLSQPEKDELTQFIDDLKYVLLEPGTSQLTWANDNKYNLILNSSLFGLDSRNFMLAKRHLENDSQNLMLIITLIHENEHRKDLVHIDDSLLRRPITDPVATFTLDTLLEYQAYKTEFLVWKEWHRQHKFSLPECNVHKNGSWLRADISNLTPAQYGYGIAMYLFWKSQLPKAIEYLADDRNALAEFKAKIKSNVVSELSDLRNEIFYYGDSFLDGVLYCPNNGFSMTTSELNE